MIVLPSLHVGGAERVAINLANGLCAAGVRTQVLLTGEPGPLLGGLDRQVAVTALRSPRARGAIRGLVTTIRRAPPDVIISTHIHVNLLLCALQPLFPSTVRLVLREPVTFARPRSPSERLTRKAQKFLYPRADLVLATSESMRSDLAEIRGANLRILANPVDETAVRNTAAAGLQRLQRNAGRTFAAVGRLVPLKAFPDLISAFSGASEPSDILEIFGEGPDRSALEQLVQASGLEAGVALRGLDPDIWSRIALSDALVLASIYEGMPNAVLEALALGTPVIATTDLAMLAEVQRSTSAGAVTLVPRDRLTEALRAVRRHDATGAGIRPSLLPPEHRSSTVTDTLLALLEELGSA
jgi:glycosyltransferase involved in cell wall biosynthesis